MLNTEPPQSMPAFGHRSSATRQLVVIDCQQVRSSQRIVAGTYLSLSLPGVGSGVVHALHDGWRGVHFLAPVAGKGRRGRSFFIQPSPADGRQLGWCPMRGRH